MITKKKEEPIPNYTISEFKMGWDEGIWRFWMNGSKNFYSSKELEEITYWKGKHRFFTIEKYNPNEVQSKPSRRTKRNRGNKGSKPEEQVHIVGESDRTST